MRKFSTILGPTLHMDSLWGINSHTGIPYAEIFNYFKPITGIPCAEQISIQGFRMWNQFSRRDSLYVEGISA